MLFAFLASLHIVVRFTKMVSQDVIVDDVDVASETKAELRAGDTEEAEPLKEGSTKLVVESSETVTHTCEQLVRWQSCPLERCIFVVIYEVMTSDGLMIRKGRYVHFASCVDSTFKLR